MARIINPLRGRALAPPPRFDLLPSFRARLRDSRGTINEAASVSTWRRMPVCAGACGEKMSEGMGQKKAEAKKGFKAGFVAIIGRPNAGKSTLVNRLVGQKVAIVTSKPQTTRNRIQGIVTRPQGQIVFVDTPGLHEATTALNRQMMREVAAALEGIDVLLMMVDASRTLPHADALLLEKGSRFAGKTILALNKIDLVPKPKLLPLMDAFARAFPFAALVPISAKKGDGCQRLLDEILKEVPEGEPFFPEDQIT